MAALTNARNTPEMADGGRMRVYPVEANTNIYLGGIVALNAAGNAVPASATTTVANPLKIIGRAEYVTNGIPGQNAINNPGAAGAISITARKGVFLYATDGSVGAAQVGLHLLCARRQQRHRGRSRKRRVRAAIRGGRNRGCDRSERPGVGGFLASGGRSCVMTTFSRKTKTRKN